jgi:hypothetical protein
MMPDQSGPIWTSPGMTEVSCGMTTAMRSSGTVGTRSTTETMKESGRASGTITGIATWKVIGKDAMTVMKLGSDLENMIETGSVHGTGRPETIEA